ncbi:MHYT domain-containing protein [Streptomyces sp. NPDC090022]|uniref:MHYT domain-containing protein n=1 Tax=Streptomyces sp. NPDC090022 TaxID=3365920 RepID=UPI0038120293
MHGAVVGVGGYGWITPLVGFLTACLGGALGLRCTTRSLLVERSWRPGWAALGATAIGSGIWTMHFIAMMGFTITGSPLNYDKRTMAASLAVAVVMAGAGIVIVRHGRGSVLSVLTGGTITGLGVASSHYLCMAGVRLHGRFVYDNLLVALSVVIAVVALTAAVAIAVRRRGPLPTLAAALLTGAAATGTHYAGMAALRVRLDPGPVAAGEPVAPSLAPMLAGPLVLLVGAGFLVLLGPLLLTARPGRADA